MQVRLISSILCMLFIKVFSCIRYELLGIAAWYVGEYSTGETVIAKALEYYPGDEYLKVNVVLYKSKRLLA